MNFVIRSKNIYFMGKTETANPWAPNQKTDKLTKKQQRQQKSQVFYINQFFVLLKCFTSRANLQQSNLGQPIKKLSFFCSNEFFYFKNFLLHGET